MVIFNDGGWSIDAQFPDTDFTGGAAKYVLPDNSPLAAKIQSMFRVIPIEDEEGNLVDVVPQSEDRTESIKYELSQLDLAAVRPMRAIMAGTATDEDKAHLAEFEMQAEKLRAELAEITSAKEA